MMDNDPTSAVTESIYVIGESSSSLDALCQLLKEQGYSFKRVEFSNAIETIRSTPPDLIIICNLDSASLCNTLKTDPGLSHLPIVIFPVDAPSFEITKIFQMGCQDYLSVPLHPQEAIARVEHQMTIIRLQKELEATRQQLQLSASVAQNAESALHRLNKNLEEVAKVDTLTQVASYQRFQEYLEQQWRQGSRERIFWGDSSQSSMSLIFCVLNGWKTYQEEQGLEKANDYIKAVAKTLIKHIKRPSDLVARYQTDTFAILLPNTNNRGGMQVAQILYEALKPLDPKIGISMGIATEIPSTALPTQILIENASQAYKKALELGGDRMVNHEDEELF